MTECERIHEEGEPVVAFVGSFAVALVLGAIPALYSFKRKADTPVTWGEAMAAAVYVMFTFFWCMVIVAQSWLTLAQDIWKWQSNKILLGPNNGFIHTPFTVTKATLSDIVLLLIYGFFLQGMIALWIFWQSRGKRQKAQSTVRRSSFGRVVAKRG